MWMPHLTCTAVVETAKRQTLESRFLLRGVRGRSIEAILYS